ncbi:MAG: hypothetical protein IJS39_00925 [Synergistaceae bacterium]|nr:hypothetical protein [Synergistaceae bacterium]
MSRCTCRTNLEVHHINRNGGNTLSNAKVLCHDCHVNTLSYGVHGSSPETFPPSVKEAALRRAGYRCECERQYCHD